MITIGLSLAYPSKIRAITINKNAQNKLTINEDLTLISNQSLKIDIDFSQSLIVEDASEFIEELNVDIAADNTPAISSPRIPDGK